MVTLVVHAPEYMSRSQGKRSFQETVRHGVGEGYAIAKRLHARCVIGCKAVLLCKDAKKRAEGRLTKLVPTVKTDNGIQRYDVYMRGLRLVSYKPERLNRNGIAVLP